jgi:hypothetical protein
MNTDEILEAIDQQITQLQKARALLADTAGETPVITATKEQIEPAGKRRGRPKGSVSKKSVAVAPVAKKTARRTMSAEGKARIAAAQKARWAAQKKASVPAKPAAKKTSAKVTKKTATATKKAVSGKRASAVKSAAATSTEA